MRIICSLILAFVFQGFSQSDDENPKKHSLLRNQRLLREISWQGDSICTAALRLSGDSLDFVLKSRDFSFRLNDRQYDGFSGWNILQKDTIADNFGGEGIKLTVVPTSNKAPNFVLCLYYMVYPELPLIRKWISIKNTDGSAVLKLEALNIEDLCTTLDNVHSVVHHNYARMKHLGRYVGDWDDPVMVVHQTTKSRGIALGNETMGILKRTAYHTQDNNIEVGLTHQTQPFPFRKYIASQEEWHSPKTFIALYGNRDDGFQVVDDEVNRFVTLHMGNRITQMRTKPTFVYNTWYPFRTNINDSLIRSVAKAAAECGIMEFVVDDGWQVNHHGRSTTRGWGENYGDWLVDRNKFPDGLAPTFDYIKSLGMKPGLWVSIASATKDAKVFETHPEWFVKNVAGKPGNLHYESTIDTGFYTASFGTE
ncbi:MAG: alpha-galactosidase [Bacteroidota bacterium]